MGGMGATAERDSKYLRHGVDASAVRAGPDGWPHEKLPNFLRIFSKHTALLRNPNHHDCTSRESALMPPVKCDPCVQIAAGGLYRS